MKARSGPERCPECAVPWPDGVTCQDYFHQMLAWESEDPKPGVVHHLMVLNYHLQHPSLYSPEGLEFGKHLLTDFLVRGITTEEVRRRNRDFLDSGKRTFKITGTPASHGAYRHPIQWPMTARDVIVGGASGYIENVRTWARSILEALQASDNLS